MIQKVSFREEKIGQNDTFFDKNSRSQKKPCFIKKTIYLIILYSIAGYGR